MATGSAGVTRPERSKAVTTSAVIPGSRSVDHPPRASWRGRRNATALPTSSSARGGLRRPGRSRPPREGQQAQRLDAPTEEPAASCRGGHRSSILSGCILEAFCATRDRSPTRVSRSIIAGSDRSEQGRVGPRGGFLVDPRPLTRPPGILIPAGRRSVIAGGVLPTGGNDGDIVRRRHRAEAHSRRGRTRELGMRFVEPSGAWLAGGSPFAWRTPPTSPGRESRPRHVSSSPRDIHEAISTRSADRYSDPGRTRLMARNARPSADGPSRSGMDGVTIREAHIDLAASRTNPGAIPRPRAPRLGRGGANASNPTSNAHHAPAHTAYETPGTLLEMRAFHGAPPFNRSPEKFRLTHGDGPIARRHESLEIRYPGSSATGSPSSPSSMIPPMHDSSTGRQRCSTRWQHHRSPTRSYPILGCRSLCEQSTANLGRRSASCCR